MKKLIFYEAIAAVVSLLLFSGLMWLSVVPLERRYLGAASAVLGINTSVVLFGIMFNGLKSAGLCAAFLVPSLAIALLLASTPSNSAGFMTLGFASMGFASAATAARYARDQGLAGNIVTLSMAAECLLISVPIFLFYNVS